MRRRCGGLDFGRSIAPAFLRPANRAASLSDHRTEIGRLQLARRERVRPTRDCFRSASSASASVREPRHRVRALGRRQPGGRAGRHAARAARARHRPRRHRRELRRRVQRRRHRRRRRPSRGVERLEATWDALRGEEVFPGGRLSRAWNLLTRDDHLFSNEGLRDDLPPGRHSRTRSTSWSLPLRVVAADLDTGDEVVFVAGPLQPALLASAALPGALPARSATTAGSWSTARSSTPCRSGTRWRGRSTGSTCSTWPATCSHRPLRSPIDVAIRAFADQPQAALRARAAQRARDASSSCVLPAPVDDRELFDFSGRSRAHRRGAPTSPNGALDDAETRPRAAAASVRRPWWRRDAG